MWKLFRLAFSGSVGVSEGSVQMASKFRPALRLRPAGGIAMQLKRIRSSVSLICE